MNILKNLNYLKKKNQQPINMSTFGKHYLKKKKYISLMNFLTI